MSDSHRVTFQPGGKQAKVRPGTTLLEASRRAGEPLRTRCGGVAGCLMCKVTVPADQAGGLKPPTPAEIRKLGPLLDEGVRLSCQARTNGDVTVLVPEDPLKAAIRKRLEEQKREQDDWWS